MVTKARPNKSPRFGLLRGARGWYKHVPGKGTQYVCSTSIAPTGEMADAEWIARFPKLAEIRVVAVGSMTVEDVLDAWLNDPHMETLSPHTTSFYRWVAKRFAEVVGKHTLAGRLTISHARAYANAIGDVAPTTRKNRLVYAKQAMEWAAKHGYVTPDFWGDAFEPPSKKAHRDANTVRQATKGSREFTPDELQTLIDKADKVTSHYPLKLWTLLGINGGLGQSDIDAMTRHHIEGDRLVFPRPKTGIKRIIPLWPETAAALNAWLAKVPPERDKLFTSVTGKELHGAKTLNIVTKEFKRLCDALGVKAKGHYSLRRTFRTIADELPDQHAVDLIMGHEPQITGRSYVQSVNHARLVAVTDHVRNVVMKPSTADGSAG